MSSHDALDVAEQNVNLHDSVHVGDVVQNINAANECPSCKTANVPVFSCMESNCSGSGAPTAEQRNPAVVNHALLNAIDRGSLEKNWHR